jgi:hypothetical protein
MSKEKILERIIGYSVGDPLVNSNTDVATINECLQAMDEYAKQKAWEAWKVDKHGSLINWEQEEVLFNQWWEENK